VKNGKNLRKSGWTSGKMPLMTKGGSLPACGGKKEVPRGDAARAEEENNGTAFFTNFVTLCALCASA
jgi:hypothetical protein